MSDAERSHLSLDSSDQEHPEAIVTGEQRRDAAASAAPPPPSSRRVRPRSSSLPTAFLRAGFTTQPSTGSAQNKDFAERRLSALFERDRKRADADKAAAAAKRQRRASASAAITNAIASQSQKATNPKAKGKKRGPYEKSFSAADRVTIGRLYAMHGNNFGRLKKELRNAPMPGECRACDASTCSLEAGVTPERREIVRSWADKINGRTVRRWAANLRFATAGVGVAAQQTTRHALMAKADHELAELVRTLRCRGAPVMYRNLIQLRAGQMLADPRILHAVVAKRRATTAARRRKALTKINRSGDSSSTAATAALDKAATEEPASGQSRFMSYAWARTFAANFNLIVRAVTASKVLKQADPVRVENMRKRVVHDVIR